MYVHDLTWMQLEEQLRRDDRIVLPLGSTEQHASLSLGTDTINVEQMALEAAEPLALPVLPALPYGVIPQFAAYPGSPSVGAGTYAALVRELVESLRGQGFGRVFVLNGHYGNVAAAGAVQGLALWHDWWAPPATAALMDDPPGGHASWVEDFPWTRVAGVEPPGEAKPLVELDELAPTDPAVVRELVGDGSFGGPYRVEPERAERLWRQAVADARAALESGWG